MMIDFPEVTRVHRRMPKEAFYKRLQLNKMPLNADIDANYNNCRPRLIYSILRPFFRIVKFICRRSLRGLRKDP